MLAEFTIFPMAAVPAGPGLIGTFAPLLVIFVIFYFLLIRPQQQRQKRHQEMVGAVKRGDTVVTAGGIVGKVTKVSDDEITLEIADGVRIRVVKGTLADVRGKGAPVAANDSKPSS